MNIFRSFISTIFFYSSIISVSCTLAMQNNQQLITTKLPEYTIEQAFEKATIVRKIEPHERLGACYTYAITHHLNIVGKAPELLKLSTCINSMKWLDVLNVYYQPTTNLKTENLVVYRLTPNSFPTHFAILKKIGSLPTEHVAESIWGTIEYILQNKLYEVVKTFGTDISYYELKPQFTHNKNLLLKDLQQKVAQNSDIKKEISLIQVMLLNLANGKNITSETNAHFNAHPTLQEKVNYLFKICMGLSVNTFRANTKETVLMLATKRNDIEMMKIFLSMGADTQRKDKDGNTALIIAEQASYFRAVELLKEYGAQ